MSGLACHTKWHLQSAQRGQEHCGVRGFWSWCHRYRPQSHDGFVIGNPRTVTPSSLLSLVAKHHQTGAVSLTIRYAVISDMAELRRSFGPRVAFK